jgi:LysM repeat protein
MAAEEINLPGVGSVPKTGLYVAGAVVVGVVGYAYWKRRQSAAVAVDTTTGSVGGSDAFTNPNPGASGSDTVDVSGSSGKPTTNDAWANAALEALGGFYDGPFVVTTLGKYLSGQPLTADEAQLVRSAWAFVGHPPEDKPILLAGGGSTPGTPGPVGTPGPEPSPAPLPSPSPPATNPSPSPAVRTYVIRSGDTLFGIASRYHVSESTLYTRNAGVIEAAAHAHGKSSSRGGPHNEPGWWIYPGTTLTIP